MTSRMQKDGATGVLRPQKRYPEEKQVILDYVADWAKELGDEAPLEHSVTRAYHLYKRSGLNIGSFTSLLYEAHKLTQAYSANVKKQHQTKRTAFGPVKNKMPYFFSILEKLVPGGETEESSATSPPG